MSGEQVSLWVAAALCLLLGGASLWRCREHGLAYRRQRREARPFCGDATGVVLSNVLRNDFRDSDISTAVASTFVPQVRFRTDAGHEVTAEAGIALPSPLPPGAGVALRYDPQDPTRVRLAAPPALEPLDTRDRLHLAIAGALTATSMLTAAALFVLATTLPA